MPRRWVSRGLRAYAERTEREDEALDSLKNMGYLLGFNSIFMGSFFYSNERFFAWTKDSTMLEWWHIRPLGFAFWDVLFPAAGLWLMLSTMILKGVTKAHYFASAVWFSMGVIWVSYSLIYHPDYVFGTGILSLFISAQHLIYARLWKAEGVA